MFGNIADRAQDGSFHYVKIILKTDQGVHDLTQDESTTIDGKDPDYFTRDLYDAIEKKDYPSWTAYAQIIDPKDAHNYPIFDATRMIPEKEVPLLPFGKITLTGNPVNYFAEVEQAAFAPANIVPGWDITPDPLLQIRMFAYGDTQRYRLGVNHGQLPINRSFYTYNPTRRDGAATIYNYGDVPNYIPAVHAPKIVKPSQYEQRAAVEEFNGTVVDFETDPSDADLVQPREFWRSLTADQKNNFVHNVSVNLYGAIVVVRQQAYGKWVVRGGHEAPVLAY